MGYEVYRINKRWAGYGVPSFCEHPKCNKEIDRGYSYACGGEPFSELGCDRYFCSEHREFHNFNTGSGRIVALVCERCAKHKNPFPYKKEHPAWIKHISTDESWKQWRENNPEELRNLTN